MTTPTRRTRRLVGVGAALGLAAVSMIGATPATADGHLPNSVEYSGQGLDDDGNIEEVICNEDNDAYVLFVLAGTKASAAELEGQGMDKSGNGNGGAFKRPVYFEAGEDLLDLFDGVTARYNGPERNAQLVISHGCPGDGPSS